MEDKDIIISDSDLEEVSASAITVNIDLQRCRLCETKLFPSTQRHECPDVNGIVDDVVTRNGYMFIFRRFSDSDEVKIWLLDLNRPVPCLISYPYSPESLM